MDAFQRYLAPVIVRFAWMALDVLMALGYRLADLICTLAMGMELSDALHDEPYDDGSHLMVAGC